MLHRSMRYLLLLSLFATTSLAAQEINSAESRNEQKIKLEFVRQLGNANIERDDLNYNLRTPSGVGVDATGNIYIADFKNHHILKFSPEGKYITAINSKGQGPGRIKNPSILAIGKNDLLYTGKHGAKKLHLFDREGIYQKTVNLRRKIDRVRILNNGYVVTFGFQRPSRHKTYSLIHIFDHDGNEVNAFGKQNKTIGWSKPGENILEMTTDEKDNIYIAMQYQYSIEKYSPSGKHLLSILRDTPYKPEYRANDWGIDDEDGNHLGITNLGVFLWGISIDSNKRIWVLAPKDRVKNKDIPDKSYKQNYEFEIYSSTGNFLGAVDIKNFRPFGWFEIFGDRLFLYDNVSKVDIKEYKIVDLN